MMKRAGTMAVQALLVVTLMTGCGSGDNSLTVKEPQGQTTSPQPGTPNSEPVRGKDLLKQLDKTASGAKEAREITAFLDANLQTADVKTADRMLLRLEQYYDQLLPGVNGNFKRMLEQPGTAEKLRELGFPLDFNKIQNDDTLKQWLLRQTEGKLALDMSGEGDFYWKIDYEALKKAYASFASDDVKAYLTIRAAESNKTFFDDGRLLIGRSELADRILRAENYLTSYPSGHRRTEVKALYVDYMEQYIHGYRYDAIDESTMKLLPAVKRSYEQLVKQHPDTKTAQIVQDYLEEINRNKDVIYHPGKKGESIVGDPKRNIGEFWSGLRSRIDAAFQTTKQQPGAG
ncbi:hypothetical protein C8Z91_03400 [Paenibacillus elgii]|uniref:DUF3829 domain-containing protein n=1 Tax=Paenibacillus elgii TaxID=189691 RepID=A0A2T6G8P9_9BACL|nr:hypothetical protein [Paenibacillus elgii]PUA40520.1 hypothetical protein C8Z91_03400 [Paenibacillus elgii]